MRFEFRCWECKHTNNWEIHPTRISTFICGNCGTYIAFSNAISIYFYKKLDLTKDFGRYRVILHENDSYVVPSRTGYYTTDSTTPNGFYLSGSVASTW